MRAIELVKLNHLFFMGEGLDLFEFGSNARCDKDSLSSRIGGYDQQDDVEVLQDPDEIKGYVQSSYISVCGFLIHDDVVDGKIVKYSDEKLMRSGHTLCKDMRYTNDDVLREYGSTLCSKLDYEYGKDGTLQKSDETILFTVEYVDGRIV